MINEEDLWTVLELLSQNGSLIGLMAREIEENASSKRPEGFLKVLEKVFVVKQVIKTESNKRFLSLVDPWKGMPNLNELAPSKNLTKSNAQVVEYPNALGIFNTIIVLKVF